MIHTDLYKINLKSLKDGVHEFAYQLDDGYFADTATDITAGEVSAEVVCTKRGDLHQLHISVDGYVVTACDRCLEEVELDVDSERDLVVKLGAEYREESDEILIIPEREGVLDLQWMLFEDVVLSLPLQRMHEDGECDSTMMSLYERMATDEVAEGDTPAEATEDIERDEEGIDLRWASLKKLREN